jgi:hypothetical protein
MKKSILVASGLIFFLMVITVVHVSATPYRIDFSGIMTGVFFEPLLEDATFSGSLVYESSTPPSQTNPNNKMYEQVISSFDVTFSSGVSFAFNASAVPFHSAMNVSDDFVYCCPSIPRDKIDPGIVNPIVSGGTLNDVYTYAKLELVDDDHTWFNNTDLPIPQIGLSSLERAQLLLFPEFSFVNVGTLTSLSIEGPSGNPRIPEPSTMLLIGSGLFGLGAFRNKFKK